jgi:hypothetical protein
MEVSMIKILKIFGAVILCTIVGLSGIFADESRQAAGTVALLGIGAGLVLTTMATPFVKYIKGN